MSSVNNTAPARTPFGVPQVGLIAIIAVVIAALTALDISLAKTEESEMHSSAEQNYLDGLTFLHQAKANAAVDKLRTAHGLERDSNVYTLALVQALMGAGKLDEAGPLMKDVLQDQPNDGYANLIAARLMIENGKVRDAEAYYHRAIYGEWPSNGKQHRTDARMELIDLLKTKGNQQDLIAELIPLQEETANNPQLIGKLAQLYLVAGSPARSADLYRSLIQQNPKDAAAYAGLGEADLERGQYHAAHAAFLQAYRRDNNNPAIRARFQLASTLAALDPTVRQLHSMEKYRRSLHILQLARSDLQECLLKQPEVNSAGLQQSLSLADQKLSSKMPKVVTNEMAEEVLDLAGKLWQTRVKSCGQTTTPGNEPLRLIMNKVEQ